MKIWNISYITFIEIKSITKLDYYVLLLIIRQFIK